MRTVAILVACTMLASCDHMYGAGDMRVSDARATQSAQQEVARRDFNDAGARRISQVRTAY